MQARHWLTVAGISGVVVIGGAALVAGAAGGDPAPVPGTSTSPASTAQTSTSAPDSETISAERAVEIATSQFTGVGNLVVEDVDLEREDGRLVWDVEFVGDREADIDARTGAVVSLDVHDDDHAADPDDHGDDDRSNDSDGGCD